MVQEEAHDIGLCEEAVPACGKGDIVCAGLIFIIRPILLKEHFTNPSLIWLHTTVRDGNSCRKTMSHVLNHYCFDNDCAYDKDEKSFASTKRGQRKIKARFGIPQSDI